VPEQVLHVEHPFGVDLLQLDQRALAEPALDRVPVDAEGVLAHVDAAAGHPGAGPGPEVAQDDRPAGGHVLEGKPLGVRPVYEAAAGVVDEPLLISPRTAPTTPAASVPSAVAARISIVTPIGPFQRFMNAR